MKLADPAVRAMLLAWGIFWVYWGFVARSTERTVRRERFATRVPHLALFTVAFFLIFTPLSRFEARLLPEWLSGLGLIILIAGLGFSVWARHHLGRFWSGTITVKEGHRLVRTGPYRLVRHPIYTGLLVGMVGSAVVIGKLRGLLAVLCVLAAYAAKIPREEQFLLKEFGDEYARYRHEVKALIPFVA